MNSIQQHLFLWANIADYYRISLTKNTIRMYAEDTSHIDSADIYKVFKAYRNSKNSTYMPRPHQLIELLNPTPETGDLAIEASAAIWNAISRWGYSNPDLAKEQMGELAWQVVERDGGWQRVCADSSENNKIALKAQWRELAKALLHKPVHVGEYSGGYPELKSSFEELKELLK